MPSWFACPYLGGDVELTDEREDHVSEKHELVLADDFRLVRGTLLEPDEIRRSEKDPKSRLFVRWYEEVEHGKYCTVVVVDDSESAGRQWIVTAYVTGNPRRGTIEWQRS